MRHFLAGSALVLAAMAPAAVHAAPEEIVVFTDEFEKPGEVGFEMHSNYANHSRRDPEYAGEQAPNRILRLMPEIAWGLSPTWNLGLHLPFSYDQNLNKTTVDGLKLRLTNLHVRETGESSSWFYGANYELSTYHRRLSESKLIAELRGIVGWRNQDWMVAVNPILNRPIHSAPGVENLWSLDVFFKIMRNVGHEVAVGIEHYAELGQLKKPAFGPVSGQTTFAILEFATKKGYDIHLGVGRGWTEPVDRRIYKMLIGIPF